MAGSTTPSPSGQRPFWANTNLQGALLEHPWLLGGLPTPTPTKPCLAPKGSILPSLCTGSCSAGSKPKHWVWIGTSGFTPISSQQHHPNAEVSLCPPGSSHVLLAANQLQPLAPSSSPPSPAYLTLLLPLCTLALDFHLSQAAPLAQAALCTSPSDQISSISFFSLHLLSLYLFRVLSLGFQFLLGRLLHK